MRRPAPAFVAVALTAIASAGCGSTSGQTPTAPTLSPSTVRHDPRPLTRRFPALGSPSMVRWQGGALGALGASRVPGPTSVAIKAVVTLEGTATRKLKLLTGVESVAGPNFPPALRSALPGGRWRQGERLNAELSSVQWQTRAWLNVASGTIALSAIGGG